MPEEKQDPHNREGEPEEAENLAGNGQKIWKHSGLARVGSTRRKEKILERKTRGAISQINTPTKR